MKPILFNTEMVQAILNGRKTVTRRLVKPQPQLNHGLWQLGGAGWSDGIKTIHPVPCHSLYNRMPYKPGDILWVRETWQFIPCVDCNNDLHGICTDVPVTYDDGDSIGEGCFAYKADYPAADRICWHPSIHMPRDAARIFLRVADVRAERLQDITTEQCKKEGMTDIRKSVLDEEEYWYWYKNLWDSTVKSDDLQSCGWDANPWVWVIEFERIQQPEEGE